jgi:hypothetical protein
MTRPNSSWSRTDADSADNRPQPRPSSNASPPAGETDQDAQARTTRFTCNAFARRTQPPAQSLESSTGSTHEESVDLHTYTLDRPRFTKFWQARPAIELPTRSVPRSYPPPRVRNSRAPKSAFLSAVSGENVQPPRYVPAVVHDLSTEMTGCPESDFSCSDSETRTWSVTVQTVELYDSAVRGFTLDLGKTYLKGDDEVPRPLGLLHTLTAQT